MSKHLRELQSRKSALVKDARALTDTAVAANRDLTDEEVAAFDTLCKKFDATSAAIDREMVLIADEAQLSVAAALGPVVTDNLAADPRRGFTTVGEFMQAVYLAEKPGGSVDGRLFGGGIGAAAPSTYGNESAGQDGGFLVPPQYAQEIFKLSLGEGSLLPLTDNVEIGGNSMAFPKDETTPWGTNGIRAYWQGEAATAIATKPVLGLETLRLKKLMALVPMTDELLDDAKALTSYLPDKVALSIRWKTNESILFGAGDGIPAGCMNSGAIVTVAKESGQATLTLLPQNLAKMIARLPPGSFKNAVWISVRLESSAKSADTR